MERSYVLGIDAGSAHVRAVLAEVSLDGSRLVGFGIAGAAGIRRGIVTDLGAAMGAITTAATRACAQAGLNELPPAVIGVGGAHLRAVPGSSAISVHRPAGGVTPLDLRRALDAAAQVDLPEGREVMHVLPRAYQVDGASSVADPIGLAGRLLQAEVTLVTSDAFTVQNLLRAVTAGGITLLDYGAGARMAGEVALTPLERSSGVLYLDIGGGTTTVAVWEEGHLWDLFVLPIGSDHITADLATVLRIPVTQAEQLKCEHGWAAESQADPERLIDLPTPSGLGTRQVKEAELAQIIGSRVEEILQLAAGGVKRSGYTGLFPAGLVLTGGGSQLRGLVAFAGDSLGLPARMASPESEGDGSGPGWTTAISLARWGAQHVTPEPQEAAAIEAPAGPIQRMKRWLAGLFTKEDNHS